ncbi:MAG: hypothetical protein CME43_01940 [Haliea sp.]|uniref:RNA polymerase sigma factor n=1 Tax=Haliea sp. TaxID=1932666 RepID=UPI000C4A3D6A|nr:sigma-70 family RNA polymerase sigma factor [Haliea sp.]MBM68180.1 hypothetical protein [Haliea sp.]MBM68223.1 hypothetical protein [Haliea sp.]
MSYSEMTANELCQKYKEGDEQAFNALYERYNPIVLARLNKLVKHEKDLIPEISQEIWLTASRYIRKTFEFKASFATYLYLIVKTRYINYFRYHKPNTTTEEEHSEYYKLFYGGGGDIDFSLNTYVAQRLSSENHEMFNDFDHINMEEVACMYDEVVAEVIAGLDEREKLIYQFNEDKDYSLADAAKELGLSYFTVKSISSKSGQKINKLIQEKFNEQFRNNYQNY